MPCGLIGTLLPDRIAKTKTRTTDEIEKEEVKEETNQQVKEEIKKPLSPPPRNIKGKKKIVDKNVETGWGDK